ncbi:MAG: PQQ-dependent sugar dehydrogenase [Alphaproteobacteria bacterium]|nr:PQQ-dependent sugar dehydrogenase [Alphaproteobacteria bacterium]
MHKFRCVLVASILALNGAAACARAGTEGTTVQTSAGKVVIDEVVGGLDHPWGLAFLPDGRLLVTERAGRLRILDVNGKLSDGLSGVPNVRAAGQGGLLDVALDPDFATNRTLYLSFAEAGDGGTSTALARATLDEGKLQDTKIIFRQTPKVSGNGHFGGRIVFSRDGHLFLTTGERQKFEPAQDLASHLGKVLRLNRDGSIPSDNPFVGRADAKPEIWSYGHRNVQGAAIEPATGALWTLEFGPAGGDELNRPEPGKNYGWPLVSWGNHYDGRDIPDPPTRPDLTDAVKYWNPSISPSGMIFYTGAMFPQWKGNILIAGLGSQALVRLKLAGAKVVDEERIALDARIRDVEQAPDGSIYLLTDDSDGAIWRLHLQR